jgi:predicted nucleotidyltransferase
VRQDLVEYLKSKYDPEAIIVYGSYAMGSSDENSDFDAMIIVTDKCEGHDGSVVNAVGLDVFIYTEEEIRSGTDMSKFVQVFDGIIVFDRTGIAGELKSKVRKYVESAAVKSPDEKEHLTGWCRKMLSRTRRDDCEGLYRWHWLLTDSLEIYCNLRDRYYFGPKRTIKWLVDDRLSDFYLYEAALRNLQHEDLEKWIECVINV